jgi:hypothetical protein
MADTTAGFIELGWGQAEAARLACLVDRFLELQDPPESLPLFADFPAMRDRLAEAIDGSDFEKIEERFLELYAHLHMNQAGYTTEERHRMDTVGGYWNHAGGLSPILKAEPWIDETTRSADFGAGNGLQGLLLQILYPHAHTALIEISNELAEIGDGLREWLGVPSRRITWVVDDVMKVPATGYDFIYLYRPVRPHGPGRDFYTRFAREVESEATPPVIFSIADCRQGFLSTKYDVFFGDGHLTCFKPSDPPVS